MEIWSISDKLNNQKKKEVNKNKQIIELNKNKEIIVIQKVKVNHEKDK